MNSIPSIRSWIVAAALLLLQTIPAQSLAAGYYTQAGRIHDPGGQQIQLRGISHFGFNALILQPQYLWSMGWKEQIAQIRSLGFNAIRVPFVPDTLYNSTPVDQLSYIDPARNPEFLGKTPLQALDLWMAEAERQGLYVLLDFHSVSMQRQYPTWFVSNPADFGLVYNRQAYTRENWIRDLVFVARRYAGHAHFIGIDIYNEPNGIVRWAAGDANSSDPVNFWKDAAEAAAAAVLAANPALLIFVQGINGNFDGRENSNLPMNWGEDFQPEAYQPLAIPREKLVLSPHTYGPDVYVKSSFGAANFPANLPAAWEALFGQFSSSHAVVIGEWGGRYGSGTGAMQDAVWQDALVDYMIGKGMRSSFYWSYTPNSGDTGGILDDTLAVRQDKLALLQRLWGTTGTAVPVATTPAATPPATTPTAAAPAAAPAAAAPPALFSQPLITDFSPHDGPIGTVVTVSGSGFSGATQAWVGAAHDAAIRVLSDTQVEVTVPAGATNGAIAVVNPAHAAFTAASFGLTGPDASGPPAAAVSTSEATPTAGTGAGGGGALGMELLALILLLLYVRYRTDAAPAAQQDAARNSSGSGDADACQTDAADVVALHGWRWRLPGSCGHARMAGVGYLLQAVRAGRWPGRGSHVRGENDFGRAVLRDVLRPGRQPAYAVRHLAQVDIRQSRRGQAG
jgi:aryl-phospho-beta-D-glucosidase BglC (GH1 family)